jgi:hypothetical protein
MTDCSRRRAVVLLLHAAGAAVLGTPQHALWAAAPPPAMPRRARRASSFRIAILTPADTSAATGATFGIAEVARTAAALGATIEAVPAPSPDDIRAALRDGRVDAVIVDGGAAACAELAGAARAAGAACVEAWPGNAASCGTVAQVTARIAPDDEARAAILAPLAAEQGGRLVREPGAVRVALGGRDEGEEEVLRVVAWHPSLEKYGAAQLNARFQAAAGRPMDERAWCGWAAAKLLGETFLRVASDARDAAGAAVREAILAPTLRFDGQKGRPLAIRPSDHALLQPLYVVRASASAGEAPVTGRVIAEVAPEMAR